MVWRAPILRGLLCSSTFLGYRLTPSGRLASPPLCTAGFSLYPGPHPSPEGTPLSGEGRVPSLGDCLSSTQCGGPGR